MTPISTSRRVAMLRPAPLRIAAQPHSPLRSSAQRNAFYLPISRAALRTDALRTVTRRFAPQLNASRRNVPFVHFHCAASRLFAATRNALSCDAPHLSATQHFDLFLATPRYASRRDVSRRFAALRNSTHRNVSVHLIFAAPPHDATTRATEPLNVAPRTATQRPEGGLTHDC